MDFSFPVHNHQVVLLVGCFVLVSGPWPKFLCLAKYHIIYDKPKAECFKKKTFLGSLTFIQSIQMRKNYLTFFTFCLNPILPPTIKSTPPFSHPPSEIHLQVWVQMGAGQQQDFLQV